MRSLRFTKQALMLVAAVLTLGCCFASVAAAEEPAAVSTTEIAEGLHQQIVPRGREAKIANLFETGVAAVKFKALEAGKVVIDWYLQPNSAKPVLVATGQQLFYAAGPGVVVVRFNSIGVKLLKHSEQLKLGATGTFTPNGEEPISSTKEFELRF